MDKALRLLLLLAAASPVGAQHILPAFFQPAPANGPSGSWLYFDTEYNASCAAGVTTCTLTPTLGPFPAGSVEILTMDSQAPVKISSVSQTGATWNLCPASGCFIYHATYNYGDDMAYAVLGSSNNNSITVTMSGNIGAGPFLTVEIFTPPTCGGSPCTAVFDGGAAVDNGAATCSSACPMATPTVSGTDLVNHSINSVTQNQTPQGYQNCGSSSYSLLWGGAACTGYNLSSSPASNFNQGAANFFIDTAMSFKLSQGTFTPSSFSPSYSYANLPNNYSTTCGPSCNSGLTNAIASGNLAVMVMVSQNTASSNFIASMAASGCTASWQVPAGFEKFTSGVGSISLAYCLNTASAGSIVPTMQSNCTCWWDYMEYSRTSGSWTFGGGGTFSNGTAANVQAGETLTATGGTNYVCIQGIESPTGQYLWQTKYTGPPFHGGGNNNLTGWGSIADLFNTSSCPSISWYDNTSEKAVGFGMYFY